jgi:predicted ATPase/DNA-binding SARP family transcriptional activator
VPAAEVRVLGPVEVVGEDGVISLPAKQRRLLAALVVAGGRARAVDELVEALWDGSPPASARGLVQVYVSQLRKALPPEIEIATRSGAYAAALPTGSLDAARFERLLGECETARRDANPALAASLADQALALWRGRAYGDLAYEELARTESERLEELRLVALEERLDARLALGRHAEAVGEVLAFADEHPFRERSHELALLALYRCGRQTEALEHFAALRARLRDELGLEPGPALRELQRRILEQDPELLRSVERADTASLPLPANPLVGRERELEELGAMLSRRDARLIVLTGAGGSGKTRLALEAARRAAPSFANGVVLAELAPLRDPALVVPTIARAVGISDPPDAEALETLSSALAAQELLLVVDNAEHVRQAAPALVELVASAPRLTLLVTSRAVLHVSGEQVFPVSPLSEDDAVELFVQRGQLLEPAFALTGESEADVYEICRRVDCLPLALELAAARIRTLGPGALRERLDTRLGLLTGGPRDLPARQQTLRETIAWSADLLGERERDVFARLAVFPGGASLEAADEVCGADLDTLGALVDDHLVLRADIGGEPRFGMLETVREYALELLGDDRERTELALAEHVARIADRLRLSGHVQREWRGIVEDLDQEADAVRAALAAAAVSGDAELQVRLAGGLWRYWSLRGPVGEGLDWIERALAAGDGEASAARACALQGGSALAWMRGDLVRAKELAEAAIPVAIEAGSTWDELSGHTTLGLVAQADHPMDLDAARRHHTRSLELAEQLGLEPLFAKLNLGTVAFDGGDHATALTLFDEVLAAHRRDDNRWGMGFALLNLGLVRLALDDLDGSRRDLEEARSLFAETGVRERHAHALQGLAAVEARESRPEEAARLLGQARRELTEYASAEARSLPVVAETEAELRAALGDAAFETAYAEGMEAEA